jgi:nucleoside-diphosphate-sugar epimerase
MVLVTGGTGLLGSHLLFQLSQKDEPIRAIFRDASRINTVEKLFQHYDPLNFKERLEKITWVNGDILDLPNLEIACENVSIVYH